MSTVCWDRARATVPVDPLALDALDGHLLVIEGVGADDDAALGWARRAPCVVVGLAETGTPSAAVDVVITTDEPDTALASVERAVEANPQASRTLVEVLRAMPALDVPSGLALESLAYSALLAGSEFARWLTARGPATARRFSGPPVRVERDGDRLRVVLSRPENRNAFSAAMRDALFDALVLAEVDPSIDEVVLAADGPAFSSGGDLTEFGTTPDVVRGHQIRTQRSVGALLARLSPIVTVHVHGACVGAGLELPAFAGRVVADPGATFRLPEIGMGLIPGAGGTVSVTRRIGRQATARLAIEGQVIDAARALALGLVDEVAPVVL